MKKDYWASLETMLKKHGFAPNPQGQRNSETAWFVGTSASGQAVTTHLRFIFKPKLQVLTVHIGWHHEAAHAFCLEALKNDWPAGLTWLSEVGLLQAPCLLLFNLANHMGWPLAGLPIGPQAVYQSAELRFSDALSQAQWNSVGAESLLDCYVADRKPFGWRDTNSAIRLAQIAGLVKSLERDCAVFDRCAADHLALIQSDMFNLGSATSWVQSLRSRLNTHKGK